MMRKGSAIGLLAIASVVLNGTVAAVEDCTAPDYTVVATGLTNPRHVRIGPDGHIYVAEAGIGGNQLQTCDWPGNMFSVPGPYMGGFTARISRILPGGHRQTVAANLPSFHDGFGDALGVSDIAWIRGQMYALVEGGGCTRGLPHHPAGVVKILRNGSYKYVADITAFVRANPVANEPQCGPEGDCEPDGVPHSMIANGDRLLVVETNHNSVLQVDPRTGSVRRIYDLSADNPAPIILKRIGNGFLLGGFDGSIRAFNRRAHRFGEIKQVARGFAPIVDMTVANGRLHVLETFALETPWTPGTGRVVRLEKNGRRTVVACGLDFPIGMASKGNSLFVSTVSYGQGPVEGFGNLVRIDLRHGQRFGKHDGRRHGR